MTDGLGTALAGLGRSICRRVLPAAEKLSQPDIVLAALRRRGIVRPRSDGPAVPLRALKPSLDGGWPPGVAWLPRAEVRGVRMPSLAIPVGEEVVFPLLPATGSLLRARVGCNGDHCILRFTATLRRQDGLALCSASRLVGGATPGPWPSLSTSWRELVLPLAAPMAVGAELVLGVSQLAGDHVAHPGLWGEPIIELATMPTTGVAALGVPVPSLATGPGRELASPLISVLMPVHNPDLAHIEAAITSVRDQLSGDWELCIADDASSDAAVVAALARHAGEDQRIRVVRHEAALGIAGATNAALELACGEYIALLDHDDVIREDALELVARALRAEPSLDMVYTDEDRISADGGERSHWFPKPGWSPDLFHTAMYTCHLGVYRRRLAIDIGGFRSEFDGSQDYDFVLRLLERTDRIGHIPHVLYSWRIHPGSAASGADAKPHAYDAARRALQGHLDRTGLGGTAELGPITTWYRVRHAVDATRRAAVILPLDGPDTQVAGEALWRSMRSWQAFAAHPFEIVFVGPDERLRAAARLAWSAGVDSAHMSFVPVAPCVPRGRLLAAAVSETSAEWLLLLDGPVEAVSPEWLRRLVGFAGQNGVAAAAGVVHDAAGRIEHGGLLCEDGWVLPVLHGHAPANGYPTLAANFRAVSGVALVSAELLASHGGLDAELGALAVVDLCLRAAATGLRSVLAAEVGFIRQRGVPASPNDPTALATLRERWHGMGPDPYYNASYWRGRGDFALA